MPLRFTLADEDAERLGCPTTLEFVEDKVTIRDLRTASEEAGIAGSALMNRAWPRAKESAGIHALTWLAMRQAGCKLDITAVDFTWRGWSFTDLDDPAEEKEGDEGKDQPSDEDQTSST